MASFVILRFFALPRTYFPQKERTGAFPAEKNSFSVYTIHVQHTLGSQPVRSRSCEEVAGKKTQVSPCWREKRKKCQCIEKTRGSPPDSN